MNDWTEGYVADHTYISNYFFLLSPTALRQRLLFSGMDFPSRCEGEPMRYLELGYGQGLSLNIHAATDQEAEFWGTDFLPEQALSAKALSLEAGLGTRLLNYSFAELDTLAKAGRLPDFDIIVMHGIWSWINEENQRHILNIIRTCLKPGGVIYVSYNAMPGRTSLLPLRKLMVIHSERKGAGKDSLTRASEAATFVRSLTDADAAFFSNTPTCRRQAKNMENQPPAYLAHEYLNQSWHTSYVTEVAKAMASAEGYFLTSANLLETVNAFQPENTAEILNVMPDLLSREMIRSFNINQGFRTDIFIKKNVSFLDKEEHEARLDGAFFAMKAPLNLANTLAISLPLSEGTLDSKLYGPILEVLAENHYEPKSLAFLRTHPRLKEIEYEQLLFRLNILCSGGYIGLAQPAPSEKTRSACQRLNRIFCERATRAQETGHLVSPVLGCCISVTGYYLQFLQSYVNGREKPADWAKDVFTRFSDGKQASRETPKGRVTGLQAFQYEAENFKKNTLPYLLTMGVIPAASGKN